MKFIPKKSARYLTSTPLVVSLSLVCALGVCPAFADEVDSVEGEEVAIEAVAEEAEEAVEVEEAEEAVEETIWAYAGITLDSEDFGVSTVYYTSTYFEGTDLVNPLTTELYTDDELAAIAEGAEAEEAEGYVEAPEDAVVGIGVYGSDTIYWYDADAAAAIVASADALYLDAATGVVTDAEGNEVATSLNTTWAYAGITLDSADYGIGTVYYTSSYFAGEGLVNPLTVEAYTDEELAAIAEGAEAEDVEGYVEAPAEAAIGVSVNGSSTIYWYDAEAAAVIVSYTDPLYLNAETGVLTDAEGAIVAVTIDSTWAYAGITLDSEDYGIGTVYYTSVYFEGEGLVNPLTVEAYTEEELTAIAENAAVDAEGYTVAPEDAVVGVSVYGTDTIYWYAADAAAAIVASADPLYLDATTGIISDAEGNAVAESLNTTWAYAGITLDSEDYGVSTVYYASSYFAGEGLVNPLTVEAYTDDELATIVDNALIGAEGYAEAPAAAALGIGVYGTDDIYWYDAEAAAAIVASVDALYLDAETGAVTDAEGAVVAVSMSTTWAYAGITLDSEDFGVSTVYYTAVYFEGTDLVNPLTTELYTEEELAAIAENAAVDAEGYVAAPEGAVVGIGVYGTDDIVWFDAEAAAAIVASADALYLDVETGVVTDAEGAVVAEAMN